MVGFSEAVLHFVFGSEDKCEVMSVKLVGEGMLKWAPIAGVDTVELCAIPAYERPAPLNITRS